MLYCNKECLQVFSFVNIHRCWHQNVPLKNMVRMLNEMFGWVWIFVWIFMLISTSNNISLSFTYAFFLKNRLPHISYMKDMGLSPSKRKAVWLIHPLFWWKHSIFSKMFGYFSIFVAERGVMENNRSWFESIKACVRYFHQICIFSSNDSPSKTMKNAFYFIYKVLFVLEIFNFLYFCLSLFFYLSAIALEDDRR